MEVRLFGLNNERVSVLVRKNEAFVINSATLHWTLPNEIGEYMLTFIPPKFLDPAVRLEVGKTFTTPYHDDEEMTVGNIMRVLHRFSRLREEGAVNEVLLPSLANSMMALMLPKISGEMLELRGSGSETDLLSYVCTNYRNPDLDSEKVAKNFGFTAREVGRILNKSVGAGLREYIDTLRINDAKSLLRTTDQSMESIAYEVGYTHVRTFFRTFSKKVGMTPGEYRKSGKSIL